MWLEEVGGAKGGEYKVERIRVKECFGRQGSVRGMKKGKTTKKIKGKTRLREIFGGQFYVSDNIGCCLS